MENAVVHRVVEQHAATHGDRAALVDAGAVVTYRDLNQRANGIARVLLKQGFRRGGHLIVSMPRGIELASVLLAVLKAGGAYTWRDPFGGAASSAAAFAPTLAAESHAYRPLELEDVLRQPIKPGPNLPVLSRPTDIACVLAGGTADAMLVPHATLTALGTGVGSPRAWRGEWTTFDLWAGLLTGATLSVAAPALQDAA